ncbi:MAG: hypothetical protein RLZZ540_2931, partial [Bacteroidota bacterium]
MKNFLKYLIFFTGILSLSYCSSSSDDSVPTTDKAVASISTTISPAMESNTNGGFTIKLSKNVGSETVISLKIEGTATNGVDYKIIANTITIPAKTNSLVIPVEVISDQIVEGDETVKITISISNNANVMVGTVALAEIIIKDGVFIPELKPENAKSFMVNKNASAETVALFYNLKMLAKTSFIVGQQDAMIANYKGIQLAESDMKLTTGYDPGINGADFMHITDDQNTGISGNWYYEQEKIITAGVVKAYDRGMVNTFSWHIREPFEGKYFYTAQMTASQKKDAFKSILVGGVNHEYYKKKLQKVAAVIKTLKGSDGKLIPIIFRPFHEFDGDWFWWGSSYCTQAEYIQNYQFTVKYLKDDLGVTNILFAFSPDINFNTESDYLSKYPGDSYVDVLGFDDYGDFNNKGATGVTNANKRLQIISKLAKERVKIAGLTETAYIVKPSASPAFISNLYTTNYYNAMTQNNVEISFMCFWNNSSDTYCTPTAGSPYENDFIQFTR